MNENKKLILVLILSLIGGIGGSLLFSTIKEYKSSSKLTILEASDKKSEYGLLASYDRNIANAPFASSTEFITAADNSGSSVVFIKTTSNYSSGGDFWDFWDFFGYNRGPVSSAGSGVIISNDGYIVTNNHVIDKADQIDVLLKNKHSYKAKVIGTDPNTDLALLKIDAQNLKAAVFGNSDRVRIGEWVLAVGNPLNLTSTVTAGIVSAKGRNINIVNSQFPIESFIQTDAAINPGNSGGALVNLKGELIGINTAIASKTGAYSGYGFAIPSNIVKKVMEDIMKHGEVQIAFLGIEVMDIDDKISSKIADDDYTGVYTVSVANDGAAKDAGMQVGDIILKINDQLVNSKAEYLEQLSYYRPGDQIKITYKRGKTIKETNAKLTNKEGTTSVLKNKSVYSKTLGCKIAPLSKIEKQRLGVNQGYRLTEISGGMIRRMGLPEGFIITSINRQEPQSVEELISAIENARGGIIIEGIGPNGGRSQYSFF